MESYSEYIAENLDKNIAYSEYIAENLDRNISCSEYIAENATVKIHRDYTIGKLDIETVLTDCKHILFDLTDIGIECKVITNQTRNPFTRNYVRVYVYSKNNELINEVLDRIGDCLSLRLKKL